MQSESQSVELLSLALLLNALQEKSPDSVSELVRFGKLAIEKAEGLKYIHAIKEKEEKHADSVVAALLAQKDRMKEFTEEVLQ